jgi:hypothetical protein
MSLREGCVARNLAKIQANDQLNHKPAAIAKHLFNTTDDQVLDQVKEELELKPNTWLNSLPT